jgi:hypothetical protein
MERTVDNHTTFCPNRKITSRAKEEIGSGT